MYPDFQVETWAYEDREEIIAVNLIPLVSCICFSVQNVRLNLLSIGVSFFALHKISAFIHPPTIITYLSSPDLLLTMLRSTVSVRVGHAMLRE